MKNIFNLKKVLIFILIFLGASCNIYATERFDSSNRMKSAIYLLWTEDQNGTPQNHYIGQVRRNSLEIDEMVKLRVSEHMKEIKFSNIKDKWYYDVLVSSDSSDTYDPNGWTYLETSLNEQAYMVYYCDNFKKIFNSRNQLSSKDIEANWDNSQSKKTNLLGSAKNKSGDPIAITIDDCLNK